MKIHHPHHAYCEFKISCFKMIMIFHDSHGILFIFYSYLEQTASSDVRKVSLIHHDVCCEIDTVDMLGKSAKTRPHFADFMKFIMIIQTTTAQYMHDCVSFTRFLADFTVKFHFFCWVLHRCSRLKVVWNQYILSCVWVF